MKQTIIAAVGGLWLAVATVAFIQDPIVKPGKKTAGPTKPNTAKKPATSSLASTIDPVCKMSVASSGATETATHAGKHYGFCSKMCKERFQQRPTDYVR